MDYWRQKKGYGFSQIPKIYHNFLNSAYNSYGLCVFLFSFPSNEFEVLSMVSEKQTGLQTDNDSASTEFTGTLSRLWILTSFTQVRAMYSNFYIAWLVDNDCYHSRLEYRLCRLFSCAITRIESGRVKVRCYYLMPAIHFYYSKFYVLYSYYSTSIPTRCEFLYY